MEWLTVPEAGLKRFCVIILLPKTVLWIELQKYDLQKNDLQKFDWQCFQLA